MTKYNQYCLTQDAENLNPTEDLTVSEILTTSQKEYQEWK